MRKSAVLFRSSGVLFVGLHYYVCLAVYGFLAVLNCAWISGELFPTALNLVVCFVKKPRLCFLAVFLVCILALYFLCSMFLHCIDENVVWLILQRIDI